VALIALAIGGCGDDDDGGGGGGGDEVTIGVALKGVGNPFFDQVADGLRAEDAKLDNVKTLIQSAALKPGGDADPASQIQVIENMLTQGVDALVVAPVSADQVQPVLERATSQDIPVVLVDTDIPGWDGKVSFVGTNNVDSGRAMGEAVIEAMGGSGELAILDGTPGATAETDRIDGVEQAVEGTDAEIVARARGDANREKSQANTEDFLQANPNLKAVVGACTRASLGAYRAVELSGRKGMIVGGHDAEPDEVNLLLPDQDPELAPGVTYITVAQMPEEMGAESLKAAVDDLEGKSVNKRIETGYEVVTEDNAADYAK
jgi:ABC-type sugar transport system substrate-binding protein